MSSLHTEKEHTSVNDSKNEHDRLIMKEEYTPVSIISEPTNITLKVVLENSGKCYFEWD